MSNGYGQVGMGGLAHRVAFELHHERDLKPGEHVMHSCDNRPCCNPSHLSIGSIADNNRDMHRKGRQAKGFALPQTKLSADDVREIRLLRADGMIMREIAEKFGVRRESIRQVLDGTSFKWVE